MTELPPIFNEIAQADTEMSGKIDQNVDIGRFIDENKTGKEILLVIGLKGGRCTLHFSQIQDVWVKYSFRVQITIVLFLSC